MFIPDRQLMPMVRDALAQGRRVRMTVTGRSMFPFVRDGDVVEIAPLSFAPSVGDVVLAQFSDGRVPLHRLVSRRGDGWLLRGDACGQADGIVSRSDLLGVAVRVERRGQRVRTALGRPGRTVAWLSAHGWLAAARSPARAAQWVLRRMQAAPAFRRLVRTRRPAYSIEEARVEDLVAPHSWQGMEGMSGEAWFRQNRLAGVTCYVARRGEETVGFVRLVRTTGALGSEYSLLSLAVRLRYRGMGIGEALSLRVIDQAATEGARELRLQVTASRAPALALYRKLGFEPEAAPVEAADDRAGADGKPVHMVKRLV